MNVRLVNPSSVSFGTAVITPRWQYVIAAATPKSFGDPMLVDETLFQMDPDRIQQGGAIGIGIHTCASPKFCPALKSTACTLSSAAVSAMTVAHVPATLD